MKKKTNKKVTPGAIEEPISEVGEQITVKDEGEMVVTEEATKNTPVHLDPVEKNTRICSCGEKVMLPNSSEEHIMCKCGIKHVR